MARRRVPIAQSDVVRGFAARLRERRVARGLTQADLARAAALTPAYVSRLEGGHIAPGIDLVERVAAALAVAPADLLPAAPDPDPLPALRSHAEHLFAELVRTGDADAFLRLNPVLALVVEAVRKG